MNPWTDHALMNDYHAGDKREAALIARENGNDEPVECGKCGRPAHYRATVGAVQCFYCRAILINRTGEWL